MENYVTKNEGQSIKAYVTKEKGTKKEVVLWLQQFPWTNRRSLNNNSLENYNPQTILCVQFSKGLPGSSLYVCMKCSTCSKWSTKKSTFAQCTKAELMHLMQSLSVSHAVRSVGITSHNFSTKEACTQWKNVYTSSPRPWRKQCIEATKKCTPLPIQCTKNVAQKHVQYGMRAHAVQNTDQCSARMIC